MFSKTKSTLMALTAITALTLTSCGSTESSAGETTDAPETAGDPVSGGTLRVVEPAQPSGFDPVQVFSSTSMPITYTALYGQFVIANPETGEYECGMCESFTTDDAGATWDVVTREGMTFTDGTPFDAEALKYNWDRMKDPQFGSASAGMASQIDTIEIVDDRTARLHMVTPTPGFLGMMPLYSLQWIASPTALEEGQEEFNKNPIGAGPFVLENWTPNGAISLTRNEDYADEPAYLDSLEIQGSADSNQRMNALLSGQADLILGTESPTFAEAEANGQTNTTYTFNGGTGFMMNTDKEPFDDVRARQALRHALDPQDLNDAVTQGEGTVPETLFTEDSPFFTDVPMNEYNPEKAQELFDELADEGKPVEFSYSVFPGTGAGQFDALQAQLAEYDNVTITPDQRDASEQGVVTTAGDYQLAYSSLAFVDPTSRLWGTLHGSAERSNYSRLDDPELNDLLDAAVAAELNEEEAEAKEQYQLAQERFAEVSPYFLVEEYTTGTITNGNVHGIEMFGYTTPNASSLWMEQ